MEILIRRKVVLWLVLGLLAGSQAGCESEKEIEPQSCTPPQQSIGFLFGSAREQALGQGREAVDLVRQQDAAALHARFSSEVAQTLSEEELRQVMQESFASTPLGEPLGELVASLSTGGQLLTLFQADYGWSQEEDVTLVFGFAPEGKIALLQMAQQPRLPPDPHASYHLQTRMRLPFAATDTWVVFWGGRGTSRAQNYHVVAPDQRHAYDLVAADAEGRTHTGDGSSNEQYFCWGRPVIAPADATVVSVKEGVFDNCPGVLNPVAPAGNHVVLDFGHGEFGLFAHLRKDSVQVSEGQQVKAGDPLGVCGNSGNSSEPHLHFHVQDGPVLFQGHGLPITFVDYVSNGQPVAEGTPVQGELLRLPAP